MKKVTITLVIAAFFAFSLPVYAGSVTKVDPEKYQNLTPEQKERFKEAGRSAQRAAEASRKEYNDVEKGATQGKEVSEKVRNGAVNVEKALPLLMGD
jgi:hypothetical protein